MSKVLKFKQTDGLGCTNKWEVCQALFYLFIQWVLIRAQACQLLCWTISRNCKKNQYGTKSQKKKTDDFYKNIKKYPLCCMSHKKTKQKKTQNFWSTCQSCSYSSNQCFKTLGLAFHDGFYINDGHLLNKKEFPEQSLKNVKEV